MRTISSLDVLRNDFFTMKIGSYSFDTPFILAPMAGITDQAFRDLCLDMGADLTVSEMLWADPSLRDSTKTRLRMVPSRHKDSIRSVQIAGCCPELMAETARYNVENGADIIDINMGCPAKKVNRKIAGSALMQHPELVEEILKAVTAAVDVPVTLKTRTGWSRTKKMVFTLHRSQKIQGFRLLRSMAAPVLAFLKDKLNMTRLKP